MLLLALLALVLSSDSTLVATARGTTGNSSDAGGASSAVMNWKLYGERNTGSRYLQRLLETNLQVSHLKLGQARSVKLDKLAEKQKDTVYAQRFDHFLGWKHQCALSAAQLRDRSALTGRVLFVVTGKNPYSWLLSLFDKPYHIVDQRAANFNMFVRKPWGVLGRENMEGCMRYGRGRPRVAPFRAEPAAKPATPLYATTPPSPPRLATTPTTPTTRTTPHYGRQRVGAPPV